MYANQSILDYTMIIEDPDGTVRQITPSEYEENIPPEKPYNLNGPVKGSPEETYTYSVETNDLNGNAVYYWFDWDDGKNSGWLGPYESGEVAETQYSWEYKGVYEIKVKAKDDFSLEGDWSDPLVVTIPRDKAINRPILNWLQSHPNLFPLLQKIINI